MSVPDCSHPVDAISANEFNRCVQCHRCGYFFEWLDGEPWEYADGSRVTHGEPAVVSETDELVMAALAGHSLRSLSYHDRGMARGRALAFLRDKYRAEYEARCRIEAHLILTSGVARDF